MKFCFVSWLSGPRQRRGEVATGAGPCIISSCNILQNHYNGEKLKTQKAKLKAIT